MRIAVTGSTGHIGACLVRRLLKAGHQVVAIARHSEEHPALAHLPVERVSLDIRDFSNLTKAFDGADVVYHLAGFISIWQRHRAEVMSVNIAGAYTAAQAALAAKVSRFVHLSSIHAFQQAPFDQILDETRARVSDTQAPIYDQSKAGGEAAVRRVIAEGLNAVIIHPTSVIGPYDFGSSLMGKTILNMLKNKMPVTVRGGFNWVDVRDVVTALINAIQHGKTGDSYLVGGHWTTVRELTTLVTQERGLPPPRWEIPLNVAKTLAYFSEWGGRLLGKLPLFTPDAITALHSNPQVNCQKAIDTLSLHARPLSVTLHDSHAWWVAQGKLTAQDRPYAALSID